MIDHTVTVGSGGGWRFSRLRTCCGEGTHENDGVRAFALARERESGGQSKGVR